MAQVSIITKALASPSSFADGSKTAFVADHHHPAVQGGVSKPDAALLTPPNSVSPDLAAHAAQVGGHTPPPINIEHDVQLQDAHELNGDYTVQPGDTTATPLSKGALSGLDASAAITPAMLAKHHLPGIMLGNGPRPIRYVMGELTQSVPGFSRIPPAKARRLVVAALESRNGGGPDGSVTFCKTGWGRWDAHVKGSLKDSGVGSFNDGHMSPPRSEHSSYAMSNGDSGVNMPRPRLPSNYRDQHSGESWTASSLREEDEDMDMLENEADKMSLDDVSMDDSSSTNDETDDEDWTACGPDALRKASLPTPGAPRWTYQALSIPGRGMPRATSRRPSAKGSWPPPSSSLSHQGTLHPPNPSTLDPAAATPEEKEAVAALLSMGASM